jgi:hypothetical protein
MIFTVFLGILLAITDAASVQFNPSEVVAYVNMYRAMHGSQPVTYDGGVLSTGSQKWAEYLTTINALPHETSIPYGENLAMTWNTDWKRAVDVWYREVNLYNYDDADYDASTGHFTQLVWNKTNRIGFGIATSNIGYVYYVMRYDPPGNYLGEFRKNVFRLVSTSQPLPLPIAAASKPPPPNPLQQPSLNRPPPPPPLQQPPNPPFPPYGKPPPPPLQQLPNPPFPPYGKPPPPPLQQLRQPPNPPFPPYGKQPPLPLPNKVTCNCTC